MSFKKCYITKLISFLAVAIFLTCLPANAFAAGDLSESAGLGAYLEEAFLATHMPGMAVAVVDADELLYSRAFGDIESADTPVILGSISKSFTAVAVMRLAEEGKIDLNAPVTDYLHADLDQSVTIRHLLNQTSGLRTYQTRDDLSTSDSFGTHVYSNLNYTLLGEVVEAVSGLPYEEYMRQNVFGPLSLTHTYTSLAEAEGIAAGYQSLYGFPAELAFPYPETGEKSGGYLSVPAGYIISSAADMGRYLQMYLRGGAGVISPKSVDAMLNDNVPIPGTGEFCGMGWMKADGYSETLFYHSGLVENYFTVMCLMPDSGRAIILLFNMNDYFVGNNLATTLSIDATRLLMGMETEGVGQSSYLLFHLVIDVVLLLLLLLAIIPLLRLKHWRNRMTERRPRSLLIRGILLHLVYPSLLLSAPFLLGIPYFAALPFAPDVMLVLIASAVLALIVGVAKIFIRYSRRPAAS